MCRGPPHAHGSLACCVHVVHADEGEAHGADAMRIHATFCIPPPYEHAVQANFIRDTQEIFASFLGFSSQQANLGGQSDTRQVIKRNFISEYLTENMPK